MERAPCAKRYKESIETERRQMEAEGHYSAKQRDMTEEEKGVAPRIGTRYREDRRGHRARRGTREGIETVRHQTEVEGHYNVKQRDTTEEEREGPHGKGPETGRTRTRDREAAA